LEDRLKPRLFRFFIGRDWSWLDRWCAIFQIVSRPDLMRPWEPRNILAGWEIYVGVEWAKQDRYAGRFRPRLIVRLRSDAGEIADRLAVTA
jgi:hypothetical protein